jgi:hypothetical protein
MINKKQQRKRTKMETTPLTRGPSNVELPLAYNSVEVRPSKSTTLTRGPSNVELPRQVAFFAGDIMNDVESEVKTNGNPNLAMSKSLRKQMEMSLATVQTSLRWLQLIDWMLFLTSSILLGMIAMGLNRYLSSEFDLTQLLAAIALALKMIRQALGLSRRAQEKQAQMRDLKLLVRQISAIELSFYLQVAIDNAAIQVQIQNIWKLFNDTELKIALIPSDPISNAE